MKRYGIKAIDLLFCVIFLTCAVVSPAGAQGSSAHIDEHNRFILNGEPFFPLGLYLWWDGQQPYPDTNELDRIADSPFDTLMHYNTAVTSDAQNNAFLTALQSRGLKLIFSLFVQRCDDINTECRIPGTISEFESYIEQKVTAFKEHPAIIAWYLNDEICPVCLEYLVAGYNKIKELDNNHPVWSVHWHTGWLLQEAHTTDIVGVDVPPNPITLASDNADTANATGKPLWLVPQIFSATQAEMRAMTYLAVNHGAKGVIYYIYSALDDTRWQQIKEVASEVDYLRPVFLSTYETNDNDIVCNNPNIDFKLRREGATYYLFAVNTKEEVISGVSVQINLAQAPSVLDTLFEGDRQVAVTDGQFTDDFGLYEVHVYRWEGATPCSCVVVPDTIPTVIHRGGTLGFGASVTNNTGGYGMALFGTKLTKPDASQTGFIWGPFQVWLNPYQTKSGHKTHTIPLGFELGMYTYHGYVGRYGNIYDECLFDFEVIDSGGDNCSGCHGP